MEIKLSKNVHNFSCCFCISLSLENSLLRGWRDRTVKKCLPCMHVDLSSISSNHIKAESGVCVCNHSAEDAETGISPGLIVHSPTHLSEIPCPNNQGE